MKKFRKKRIGNHIILYADYRKFELDIAYSNKYDQDQCHLVNIRIAFWALEIEWAKLFSTPLATDHKNE